VRGQSGGVSAEAVAGVGEVRAPVSGGVGLQLEWRRGRWLQHGVRAEREKSWHRGEEIRPAAVGCPFNGGRRGGSGGGWGFGGAWLTRGGSGESEGGGVQVRRGSATGRSAACCRAIVEGGGVGATRDDAADRRAGMRRGPVVSGWVWGEAAWQGGSARC
jgi:hypothetical protein